MLSLETPPIEIGGLLLFPDHLSVDTWYYAAPNPHITRADGRLMFDIFSYSVELKSSPLAGTTIPDELGAGFLTMGADCALTTSTDQILTDLANHLGRDRQGLSLTPIPYTKGSVSVIALDASSGAVQASPSPAATPGRPTFVSRIVGGGTPSLLGNLASIFSLSLSQEGVTFLQGLYAENAAPIGIVYDLKFLGLRPSVQAKIHADVSQIYNEFGGRASAGCGYVRAEVEDVLTTMRQKGEITVELTSQAVGDEATKAEELAMSLFKDRIIQQLFDPTSTPKIPAFQLPGMQQKDTSFVTLSLKIKKDEEFRDLQYDFSLRAPEERTHAPQAFLGAELGKDEFAEHVHHIDLADSFFETLEVLVTGPSAAEFAALNLRSATVDITYGTPADPVQPATGTVLFRPGGPTDITWAAKRNGRRTLAYSYTVTYEFERDVAVDADALTYTTPARTRPGRTLSVRPYDDLSILDVEVQAGRLPADVTSVDIALDYLDQRTKFKAHQDFRLDPAHPAAPDQRRWQVRSAGSTTLEYTASATLTFADPTVWALPPVTSQEPLLRVDAPFTANRTLLIQPNVTSADLRSITVEIDYDDQRSGYRRRFVQTLLPVAPAAAPAPDPTAPPAPPAPAAPPSWLPLNLAWPVVAPDRQEFRYRVTTSAGGIVDTGDWITTSEPSLLVGDIGSRSRVVTVRLLGPTLAEVGLDAVAIRVVAASPRDPAADALVDGAAPSLFFDATAAVTQTVTVPAGKDAQPGFRYQTTTFKTDGTQSVSGWMPAPNTLIPISTRTL